MGYYYLNFIPPRTSKTAIKNVKNVLVKEYRNEKYADKFAYFINFI